MALVMTVNPGFAGQKIVPFAERKVRDTRALLDSLGAENVLIEVDGNISPENGVKMSKAGADIFVLGTSAFVPRRPLPLAQVAFSAAGGAPIAPPREGIKASPGRSWQKSLIFD